MVMQAVTVPMVFDAAEDQIGSHRRPDIMTLTPCTVALGVDNLGDVGAGNGNALAKDDERQKT